MFVDIGSDDVMNAGCV